MAGEGELLNCKFHEPTGPAAKGVAALMRAPEDDLGNGLAGDDDQRSVHPSKNPIKAPPHPFPSSQACHSKDSPRTNLSHLLHAGESSSDSAMEMRKIACAVLVAAAAATTALATEAPAAAPGPASASFAATPAVGAVIGASVLSFFAFYLQ
ncbi:E3 ubiquitin-protein ligase [Musa troglodytarum]|nr:E3 ubiquitin-protein ligase [Musa troglodytarum]